ncbi:NAD-dependent epimerase/dehydratase family protein [Haladaptatus pallidirubidus]|uniref:NAD(P)-dependent oxidoreductase n=1 Tax=Haladaptatus pallidirubidus TaxID=1008152 RepID=A0AAV3URC1_9EURY|nr:NAD(P)-dependent oxidoreductase [Haladaptatus pallidirubidus]
MHVLVTGGCGYIGSVLVPQLLSAEVVEQVTVFDSLEGGSPRNLVRTGLGGDAALSFQRGDVRKYGSVESAMRGVDAVIHLAAITGADNTHNRREETFAVNYGGTENVLTASGKLDVETVVFASSCNNYGRTMSRHLDEETDAEPLNPYAESKLRAERLLAEATETYGFDGTVLRMSTNYGYAPGVRFNLVVNHFVFRALTNRPLTVYGDGSNWRPFIHVRDAARAYSCAARHPERWPKTVYNVGSNEENYRIAEIAEIVREELDQSVDVTYLGEKQPGPSYHVNFDRLGETGFEPKQSVRSGIVDLARRFQERTAESSPTTAGFGADGLGSGQFSGGGGE